MVALQQTTRTEVIEYAAVHESGPGTKRQFATLRKCGRYWMQSGHPANPIGRVGPARIELV